MVRRRRLLACSVFAVPLLVVSTGCSSTSNEEQEATAQQLGEQLVAATQTAGVSPRLTVDLARSLYGTDAPAVCDAFDDGTSTAAELILRGNTAQGRRKTITDNAVVYAGLVVQTYCPDVLADFEDSVSGNIDAYETDT